jgi:diaminopimelate epimerase
MKIRFSKMHGLGNDFVVIDAINQPLDLTAEHAKFLGNRHFGVGCDQILVVERARTPGVDFRYRIFNADGGEVEQCGNGARCFARFVHDQGLTDKTEILVETQSGLIAPRLTPAGEVTVDMGVPILTSAQVPFASTSDAIEQPLQVGADTVIITAVSMGNPHAVQLVNNVDSAPVATQGPLIESHPRFTSGCGCMNAARARRWPVALAPVPQW